MKPTLSAVTAVLVSLSVPAAAGEECARMEDSAKRLLCYDLKYRTKQTVATVSRWQVAEQISKISDVKNVVLQLDSLEPLSGRFGRKAEATLVITCREKKTLAYIVFGGHFMSDHSNGTVTYRIDKRPAVKKRMQNSNDHQALGLWDAGEAIPFIRELVGGTSLYVQATPHSESAVSAEFPISGLAEAIKPLQEACNWKAAPSKTAQDKPQ